MQTATKTPKRLLVALTLAAAFGGFAATAIRDAMQTPAQAAAPVASEPATSTAAAPATVGALPAVVDGQPLPSLAPMLARVTPAVVSVHTKQRVRVSPFGGDPIFRRMFPELTQERINESLGSGVIVDAQRGYILTNHHVIEGADEVSVTLADGRTLAANFVGSDPDTDVAVMQVTAEDLDALPLAATDTLRVGDFVVAVGNPFGIGQTVTSGIVSAVGRSGLRGLGFQNFIQTDASINPGNSGGALVNLKGELVGINTASFNPRGSMAGNIGLSFAIPTGLARSIMDQLIANDGVVIRGAFGVETQPVTRQIAQGLGLDDARGALVNRVYSGSAAAAAGIQVGDVIVAADGQRIDGPDALRNFEGLQPVGSRVALDIRRDGEPLRLQVALREQPRTLAGADLDARLQGAVFAELPERLRQAGADGVLVESVAAGSRAAVNGLRAGDVVVAANSGRFDDLPGFRASFTRAPAQLVLRVVRGGRPYNALMR
ncbi:trypsin-like peptidase domain-containing protein [Marilutibacter chinensis]|uniref:Trypsin-like peptidase domain-containing protein n=1 Tax=Marilutibacter chinensis TaxID=2912247 RepID=A0ABS9HTN9_9GAMM|nr:trypsin-like peptidase domain-containing protein [Lysobacter chinensis]MCF7221452.1 trypsin-like peptidase domain-containing protein [Lysobacter chinensis]